jgi:hypothetical protein
MTDIAALNAEILSETAALAEAYARRFHGAPEAELRAWLHVAARREAMVSDVYGEAERCYRLPEPRTPAGDVAWEAITLIWQHEKVHTTFIEARLKDGILQGRNLTADLLIWLGAMEGRLLAALTGRPGLRRVLAALALRVGAAVMPGAVPGFAAELAELGPREFFLLCGALETTARQSYARMAELAGMLAASAERDGQPSLQLENLVRGLHLTELDEAFHEQAFHEMAGWVEGGALDPQLTGRDCALRLARLLPRGERSTRDGRLLVVTDGGLGKLFKHHGISLAIA